MTKRILLIDDDDAFRTMLAAKLKLMGHAVVEADDGGVGLTLLMTSAFDVVLTDLIMPGKEGLETIREIRRNDRKTKIIAMSGGGRGSATDYLRFAEILGANRVLQKPFTQEALGRALDDAPMSGGS